MAPAALFAQVADVTSSGDTLTFTVKGAGHKGVELRVTGGDVEYSKSFAAGRAVTFSLRDLPGKGADVEDREYFYELRLVPNVPDHVKAKLAAARAAGDEKAANAILKAAGIAVGAAQSGSFVVANHSIVPMGNLESNNGARTPSTNDTPAPTPSVSGPGSRFTPRVQDQVIPDDLIVQGSACVGFDCVNNESFGFDTIRLKENNTRIKFEDTSTGSFPTNDWQLTANDSASGSSSKFSIEDITGAKVPFTVTAGASTNSIFVDSTGRIGARTGTPVLDFHIQTSNTPAIRLEQTNSGGFTAQTWDVAGNEANFFVRDVTSGSRLPLRIRPGAPTSSLDISADGDIGIGTASPGSRLSVVGGVVGVNGGTQGGNNGWTGNAIQMGYDSTADFGFIQAGNFGVGWKSIILNPTLGNVGVGNTAPASRLHVSGDIRVTGGSFIDDGVTLTAPDYVFEESYKLLTLDEVSSYIKANKHLPNVPSAKEIKANGLNMSQFQMRLLEKIEELTLYTLDQHENIRTLKAENEQLMKRLVAIEAELAPEEQQQQ